MNKLLKTSHHLAICSANFKRLEKILGIYSEDYFCFEIDKPPSFVEFKIIDRSNHTIIIEAKNIRTRNRILEFTFRIHFYLDAKLAEVISFQNEIPVPFFMKKPKLQSLDEKYQQNRMLTEWLEFIFINGRVNKEYF
tara:strand:+ start:282 stop:692 length:411 start_codon:yes stop_codon:yes gene_type:complete